MHAGTVHRVKYAPGLGLYIWIISDDGYVEVYQEGFLSITDIYVNKDYIDKKHDNTPCKYYWKDNGTWLNPMKIIEDNLRAAGKDPVQ